MNFLFGGTLNWIDTKKDPITEQTYYPQPLYLTQAPHTHDHIGGGGIAFNAWHSAMILSLTNPFSNIFFRFTTILDQDSVPVEIPDGIAINDELIQDSQTYNSNVPAHINNIPRYLGVWQFIYSPEKLEARWASLEI
jgi:hypothetical protein